MLLACLGLVKRRESLKAVTGFCTAKNYIGQFESLEGEVNRLQRQVIQKLQDLRQIKEITDLPVLKLLQRELFKLSNQPYQNQLISHQKQLIKHLQQGVENKKEEGAHKATAALKLKRNEQESAQLVFLADLARFSHQYQQFVGVSGLKGDIGEGIELSHKCFVNILDKEEVLWIGKVEEEFDPQIHDRVEGNSSAVTEVLEQGFKIKGKVIDKAKVKLV